MIQLIFERGKKVEYKNLSGSSDFNSHVATINRIANRYDDLDKVIQDLKDITPSDLKLGRGGNHIWCANTKNERIYIIAYSIS